MTTALARLSANQRRLLAVLLLLAAVAAVLAVVLLPAVLLHRHYDEELASLSQRLGTYRRVAAQAPEYRKALEAMRERDARRFFLKNTAANLAGAELQEQVRAAIEGNGGRISTSQNQSPRDDGRFKQIVVNVQFFASTPNLQKILHAIETQQPYLVVDGFTLRPMNAFRGFRPMAGQEPEVNVQLEVAGYAYPEPPKAPPSARTTEPAKVSEPPKSADQARKAEPPKATEPVRNAESSKAADAAKTAAAPKGPEPAKDVVPAKGTAPAKDAESGKAPDPAAK